MNQLPSENSGLPDAAPSYFIQVIGVGGAGGNAVAHLARESLQGVNFAVMNTDSAALAECRVAARLTLGTQTARGLGAGGDPERGRAAAVENREAIRQLCLGARIVFVVAGLGGGTGTGAAPVVARIAKESGALVLGIVMLPFECEGSRRRRQAEVGLSEFKAAADGVICLPNQRVLKLIDEKTPLLEAFQITNEFVAQGVRGIWRLLSRPGLINVDFADLCSVTQGHHAESSLASAEARGDNRAREVIERLLAHPLIEGGQTLAEASAVLVSIAAGPDLTMTEVNRIMEQINRQCEQAHIIMGAAVEEVFGDRISVTLVVARKSAVDKSPASTLDATSYAYEQAMDLTGAVRNPADDAPRPSRFQPPSPLLTEEKVEELLSEQSGLTARQRKKAARLLQGQLPLEIINKGRFEKSEPTILHGQDLDVPTYIRRGIALN